MRSKLQTSLAELHKLKNQIRVELNQIRPRNEPITIEKRDHSAKRLFTNKYQPTDILNPSAEKSQIQRKAQKRRFFDSQNIFFTEKNRSTERKHFGRHYADSISLQNNIRKTHSPYFSTRPSQSPPPSTNKHESTSLYGIGLNDKPSPNRSCIKVYHNRQTSIA